MTQNKPRIAILASGNGTNAERLVKYFAQRGTVQVAAVMTNVATAPVIGRLKPLGIDVEVRGRDEWKQPDGIARALAGRNVELVVLAGFLAMVREPLLSAYSGRIVNLHPSLLPLHGGKGMWGMHVHEAVLASGDTQSGITIHLVTAEVDGGAIVEQHSCPVLATDTPQSLAERVHQLEYRYFPAAVERLAIEAHKQRQTTKQ